MCKKIIFGSGVSAYKDLEGTLEVCRAAFNNGIRMFDTAPSYRTEEILSQAVSVCAKEYGCSREDYFMQTKIDPIQMHEGDVIEYFKDKLKKMCLDYVDSLLIHWPLWRYFNETWKSMTKLKKEGYAKRIGICNLRISHLEKLEHDGIIPEIVQIERHPLNTFEAERLFCLNRSIELQDYSPLCKMHPVIAKDERLLKISEKHSKDIGQVILRWHQQTGAIPIFTSTKPRRVAAYAHLDDFSLSSDELNMISSLNCNHKLYLESLVCPDF